MSPDIAKRSYPKGQKHSHFRANVVQVNKYLVSICYVRGFWLMVKKTTKKTVGGHLSVVGGLKLK